MRGEWSRFRVRFPHRRLAGKFLSHTLGKILHERVRERNAAGASEVRQHAAQLRIRRQLDQRRARHCRIIAQRVRDAYLDPGRTHVGGTAATQRAGVRREIGLHRDATFESDLLRPERDQHAAQMVAVLVAPVDHRARHASRHALHIGEAVDHFVGAARDAEFTFKMHRKVSHGVHGEPQRKNSCASRGSNRFFPREAHKTPSP
jgi:hypothetical protein